MCNKVHIKIKCYLKKKKKKKKNNHLWFKGLLRFIFFIFLSVDVFHLQNGAVTASTIKIKHASAKLNKEKIVEIKSK